MSAHRAAPRPVQHFKAESVGSGISWNGIVETTKSAAQWTVQHKEAIVAGYWLYQGYYLTPIMYLMGI